MKKTSTKPTVKRYSLSLPQSQFDELTQLAEERGVSVVDIMRSCFHIGSLVYKIQDNPSESLIWRRDHGKTERELHLLT